MEVHQLRYFCAVSETGSFTRAAEKEQVAQPSLSQQIMKLEEELGVRLFDRLGRTVRLTGFGQVFLPRARAILGELKAAKDEVAERQSSVSGPVSIGVIPTIAPYFLPLPMALFSRKYPQVSMTVAEDVTARLMDRLRAGVRECAEAKGINVDVEMTAQIIRIAIHGLASSLITQGQCYPWKDPERMKVETIALVTREFE